MSEFANSVALLEHGSDDGLPADMVIGLVNNMPPAAKRATQRQFAGLLTAASLALNMRISLFTVETGERHDDIAGVLEGARPDGLIVTGAEPRSITMTDEPFWPMLAALVDWASDNTISTIWSCLAAHAAVFRLDEIGRKRLPRKLSGVFECSKASDHTLLANAPPRWLAPHSRHNTLDEAELSSKGYTVLSHAPLVGADSFVKQNRASLFLLLQGHLEYSSDSLLGEYRRDVRRFLAGRCDAYPDVPENYFDRDVANELARLRERARRTPDLDLLASVDAAITAAPEQTWNSPAAQLYTSWLSYLATQKAKREDAAAWSARLGHVAI